MASRGPVTSIQNLPHQPRRELGPERPQSPSLRPTSTPGSWWTTTRSSRRQPPDAGLPGLPRVPVPGSSWQRARARHFPPLPLLAQQSPCPAQQSTWRTCTDTSYAQQRIWPRRTLRNDGHSGSQAQDRRLLKGLRRNDQRHSGDGNLSGPVVASAGIFTATGTADSNRTGLVTLPQASPGNVLHGGHLQRETAPPRCPLSLGRTPDRLGQTQTQTNALKRRGGSVNPPRLFLRAAAEARHPHALHNFHFFRFGPF